MGRQILWVRWAIAFAAIVLLVAGTLPPLLAQDDEEVEEIDSTMCADCHAESAHGTPFADDIEHSTHAGFECLDCHQDRGTFPHVEDPDFSAGQDGCGTCHFEAMEVYTAHGKAEVGSNEDIPECSDCHGAHDVLRSDISRSRTHPMNLPATCGVCHEDLNLTTKYEILVDQPIQVYESSVHGQASQGGVYVAATCNDCHSTGGSAHRILSPGHPESAINHFNIPETCSKCHKGVANDFMEGIHGKLVARGETDAPICTTCHGEHGILSSDDPRSPVAPAHVAEMTCSPCHESARLNDKYGVAAGRLSSFIDSYHGLKSKAGDTHVANCASCHGVHRILPSTDPESSIYPENLQATCGECHPGISAELASAPIHDVTGGGLRSTASDIVERIYIVVIVVTIGLMIIHWLIDLSRHIRLMMRKRPVVRRMSLNEVWQHAFLMVTFVVLVISGFSLRFSESWFARLFFGWDGGFGYRGLVHRVAAILFTFTVVWHLVYLLVTLRGRTFLKDMIPTIEDGKQLLHRMSFALGMREDAPRFGRFSYVEKMEYWALIWGTFVMLLTGFMLWFDNLIVQFIPKGLLDVALVVHYWEAWLATLAILVWHLYSTVYSPDVYPMNPSWITGYMPEDMYKHEHAAHFEDARRETEEEARATLEDLRPSTGSAGGSKK